MINYGSEGATLVGSHRLLEDHSGIVALALSLGFDAVVASGLALIALNSTFSAG